MLDINFLVEHNSTLFETNFQEVGLVFQYRLLTRKEYQIYRRLLISGAVSETGLMEDIFERCYLKEIETLGGHSPAGIPFTLGRLIFSLSGIDSPEALKEHIANIRERNPPDAIDEYIRAIIASVYPYKLEELENMDHLRFLELFVIAENVLCKQNPDIKPLEIKNIKDPREIQAKSPVNFAAENKSIRAAMGPTPMEALDGSGGPDDKLTAERQRLSRAQLRKLSRR